MQLAVLAVYGCGFKVRVSGIFPSPLGRTYAHTGFPNPTAPEDKNTTAYLEVKKGEKTEKKDIMSLRAQFCPVSRAIKCQNALSIFWVFHPPASRVVQSMHQSFLPSCQPFFTINGIGTHSISTPGSHPSCGAEKEEEEKERKRTSRKLGGPEPRRNGKETTETKTSDPSHDVQRKLCWVELEWLREVVG